MFLEEIAEEYASELEQLGFTEYDLESLSNDNETSLLLVSLNLQRQLNQMEAQMITKIEDEVSDLKQDIRLLEGKDKYDPY
jgi:hypothetical protein